MQTHFSPEQLADPRIAEVNDILRACVHCGFCTATCPTYVLRGDELDSPRGRIYLIKSMLEEDAPASAAVTTHIDRCLSCLSCMTTCPADVDYMHLVDYARIHVAKHDPRPAPARAQRALLAQILPRPGLFRAAMLAAVAARPFAGLLPAALRRMLRAGPGWLPPAGQFDRPGVYPATGPRKGRVALLAGCVQRVLDPEINDAAVRLLNRAGIEVVLAPGAGCCGALAHHLGRIEDARRAARRNIAAWTALADDGLDAIVTTASGCGTMLKDYGHVMRGTGAGDSEADRIAGLARDISEFVDRLELDFTAPRALTVAYQSACSLQHGQKLHDAPARLLRRAGFALAPVAEAHLCCGSAGTYNLLQPDFAIPLGARKAANLMAGRPDVIASGNIGCIGQLKPLLPVPIVHTVQLIDWAHGGPEPSALAKV